LTIKCLINIWKVGDIMNYEKTDITIEDKTTGYLTTLDEMLKPIEIEIFYTGNNWGRTLSLKINSVMITLDYNELKKKVGDINE
jgi:hypothetical protein